MSKAPSDLIIIAAAHARPGKEKKLEQALRAVAEPTRAQSGSVEFSLYRSLADPSVIIGFERWASKEEHGRHLQGEHVQRLMAAMSDILAEPPQIVAYEIVDDG
jgi:quinol monooxygenase YgiN